jgi:CHAD domain-containing protein
VDAVRAARPGAPTTGLSSTKKAEKRRRRALRSASAADVVLSHVGAQVAQVRTQDLPVRLDRPGAVHAMRVASRRLRSALTTYEPLFHGTVTRPLGRELRWLAGVLGAARDAEVMRDRLNAFVEEERDDAHLAGTVPDEVRGQLEDAYRQAHDEVLAQLDGDRYRTLLATLGALIEHPPFKDRAARPARDVLPALVATSYEELRSAMKAARKATGDEREQRLHAARKAAKRTRYAAESVAPVVGKAATRFASAIERVQEALGEHLESGNTQAKLLELAASTPLPSTAFTYGRLHAQEDVRAERTAARVDAAWAAASRKRLRAWLG